MKRKKRKVSKKEQKERNVEAPDFGKFFLKGEEKKVGRWVLSKRKKAKEGWGIVEQKKREKGSQVCHSGGQAVTFSFTYFMF